jgi:benzoyl-CoA reductase/2-hydroxyglutaryl-CoA dehydratase subunit BcrC/BadD/HgdB
MAKDIYEDFLRLTDFGEDEIPKYLPEWRGASAKIGLNEDDIRFATEEQLPNYFHIELKGMRKAIGASIKEVIDLTKAYAYKEKGYKIVYGILPAVTQQYYALKRSAPDKVYVSFPDAFIAHALNPFFHKLIPYLEEAEKSGLSYGCRHCALNKTRYIARKRRLLPSADISWIWGLVCDEGPKSDEFITLYEDPDWKTYVTRLPHDQSWGTVEDEVDERVEYLASQMRDGFEFVQKAINIHVTEEKLKESDDIWQRYLTKLGRLARLMASEPQPLGGVAASIFSWPLLMTYNTGMEEMEEALDIILQELEDKVARKEGVLPVKAPKLMTTIMPSCVPWVVKMFEENGVGLPYSETSALTKKQLLPSRFDDPYMRAAERWLRVSLNVNPGYAAELIYEKMETYGIDGIVFSFFDFDRWLGSDDKLLVKVIREKTTKPVFYFEGDVWDDRDYSPEALRTRIESICGVVEMQKG